MQVLGTSRPRRFVRFNPLVIQPARWRNQYKNVKSELQASRVDPRRIVSLVLLATGAVLCTYVAGNYAWMYAEQKKLLREWKNHNSSATDESLIKLSIPRIGLRAVVLEGTSSHSLLLGPAHMTGSAIPGDSGNAVIAGHRDTFFRRVHRLRYGDDIYISRAGKLFHYTVAGRKIVEPTDLSVLRPSSESELTLITCYPTHVIGPAPQRLIVLAKLTRTNTLAGKAMQSPTMLALSSK